MKHAARSFPPIVTPTSRALILGSMPGIKSLEAGQYYAHPQNQFWNILGEIFASPISAYAERVAIIEKNGLALWDVLESCVRIGSLDTSIDNDSITVNDFADFFNAYPKIIRVFFNGAKAEHEFNKRVRPILNAAIIERLFFTRLPSTSPAHAGMKREEKEKVWKNGLYVSLSNRKISSLSGV